MAHSHSSPDDIYRGERPSSPQPSVASVSTATSGSSSSSSTSSIIGGRLGALAAKVEHAISRWAKGVRGNASSVSSDSSSTNSTSSSSSEDSINTLTKSQIARRRRRRPSVSSLRTLQSERDIAARIMRMKALEESRQIPRMFSLYLPEALLQREQRTPSNPLSNDSLSQRLTVSSVLPDVLAKLEAATHKPAKPRRTRHRHRGASSSRKLDGSLIPPIPDEIYDGASTAPPPPSGTLHPGLPMSRRGRKGKSREVPQGSNFRRKHSPVPEEPTVKPQPWFLDVANPTWADLRAIGKMLHIHPLTLEDILSRDPREKLEIFSKLGYYVISFRAIESEAARERLRRENSSIGVNSVYDEAEIGEANVYLTVFNDGICCFHYTDVSEHTDRVRNRLVLLEKVINMTSDWIAYELVDSIVDSFFPVLERIDREVVHIENLVFASDYHQYHCPLDPEPAPPSEAPSSPPMDTNEKQPSVDGTTSEQDEKYASITPAQKIRDSFRPRFTTPQPTAALLARRVRRFFGHTKIPSFFNKDGGEPQLSATQLRLFRMAKTRKLVTALGRLLTAKSDVVTQIRKRLVRAVNEAPARVVNGEGGRAQKDGHSMSDDFDIAIYLGDVQDHILTLQHSLAHYERMLSQSHPTYLAQLRSKSEAAKAGTDMNLFYLTVVSLSVLCMQTLTGLFSLNVNVPRNTPDGPNHTVFGIVVGLALLILCTYLAFVRYWWLQAKKRHRRQL